ncbi:hypothetical protein [Streptomyces tibetensis]|uniref:hypothetical protein n=1 Tax=Streptomyces tibetensis TaxID=2382123 RepID=UPI0034070519
MSERVVPARVLAAERIAVEAGFTKSCIREVGRLLRTAASAKPAGVVAESGTGSSWTTSPRRPSGRPGASPKVAA